MKKQITQFRNFTSAIVLFGFVMLNATVNAQFGTSPWSPVSGTYTVPIGVSQLTVQAWGGGGSGGSAYTSSSPCQDAAAGGGGGGAFAAGIVSVIPGQDIVVNVGLGAPPGTGNRGRAGTPGGTSSIEFNSTVLISAAGGDGGLGKNGNGAVGGGTGGSATSSIGTVKWSGGNGGTGYISSTTNSGGGGGGGAGTTSNGADAPNATSSSGPGGAGGTVGGGKGGNGAHNYYGDWGQPGAIWGGGGGGADSYCDGWGSTGGMGGDGTIIISYTPHIVGPQWLNQNCATAPKDNYIDGGPITPTPVLQSISNSTDTANYGYIFWTFNASADSTYYFDLCSSTGVTGDSWLRIHNNRVPGTNYCMDVNNTPTLVLQNNINGCTGTGAGLSKLIWTCQSSGTYYLETASSYLNYWGSQGNQTAILNYRTLPSFSITCTEIFYDKGINGMDGAVSGYNNNEDWIYTYYPLDTIADAISVQFVTFSTSPGDILCVYNGNSINAPIIGCYSGPSISGTFMSSANDGSLTFQFTSDDSLISTGWEANVSCVASLKVRNYTSTNRISVYPNPVNDILNIRVNDKANIKSSLVIENGLGEIVYQNQITESSKSVDLSFLRSGIYFLKLIEEEKVSVMKIVKQ